MFGLSTLNEYFVKALEYLISLIKGSQVAISVPELPAYSTKNLIFAILFVCIIPTITEELLIRKIVLDGLKEVGEVFAVFIGGLLFSIFHMNPAQTVYQFIVGSAFCYVALKGGNYLVTMLAHFINNLFIVLNYYFFKITFNPIMEIIVTVLGVVCFIIGLIILYKKGEKARAAGDGRAAEECFKDLLKRKPDSVAVHLQLGNVYDELLDDPQQAALHYRLYLEAMPDAPDAELHRRLLAPPRL